MDLRRAIDETCFILVLGVPAAGKTTLCRRLAARGAVVHVASGDEKKALLAALRPTAKLSRLGLHDSLAINDAFYRQTFTALAGCGKPVLIDSHATYSDAGNPGDFLVLTPETVAGQVAGLVTLHADPETIRQRRLARGRAGDSVEIWYIRRECIAELLEARHLATLLRVRHLVLDSRGDLDALAHQVTDFVTHSQTNRLLAALRRNAPSRARSRS